ncbi:MAG: hypothetical protein AMXMBFR82_53250 [Candidatus Hydrogenedentota bacterium]
MMKTLFYVFAAGCFLATVLLVYKIVAGTHSSLIHQIGLIISFLGAGLTYFVFGLKNYQGYWSSVIGVFLIALAGSGLSVEIRKRASSPDYDELFGIVLVAVLTILGGLLILAGHKLHRCILRLEQLEASPSFQPGPKAMQ